MAAAKKFRIPTVDEMELAEKESSTERIELFKRSKDSVASVNVAQGQSSSVRGSALSTSIPSHTSTSLPPALRESEEASKKVVVANFPTQSEEETAQSNSAGENATQSNSSGENALKEPGTNKTGASNSLIVNTRQRGNPILKSVRNIPWEYGNIVPDYVMGQSNCALFLSLRYHQLHPNYIHERLKLLGRSYELRVILVQVDVKEPHHILKELAKMCILADCTLVLAFSAEEAGRYLETYKIFENKPPEAIMEKTEENFISKFTDCLTRVKSVNKTDCATLLSHFGNLSSVIEASTEDLSLCPGFGPQKAKRLHDMFHEPFKRSSSRKRSAPVTSSDVNTR